MKLGKNSIFLTGATGLLGSYLLKILLLNHDRIYLLVRDKNNINAEDRVRASLKFWDKGISSKSKQSLRIFVGDITKEDFGLSVKEIRILKNEVDEIFHLAAITDIKTSIQKIRLVNVIGTKNILNFAISCKNFNKLNYISTAYVCGNYQGIFREDDLFVGQKFSNTYAQSKFEAEKIIDIFRKKIKVNVFRPALIVGESGSGKIPQFKNIYQFLRLCSLEIFDVLPFLEGNLNIVNIDDVSRAIYLLSKFSLSASNNYHIFPNKSIPVANLVKIASSILKFKMPKLVDSKSFSKVMHTPSQIEILKRNILTFNFKVILNSKFTERLLENFNFHYHAFEVNDLIKFINFYKKCY